MHRTLLAIAAIWAAALVVAACGGGGGGGGETPLPPFALVVLEAPPEGIEEGENLFTIGVVDTAGNPVSWSGTISVESVLGPFSPAAVAVDGTAVTATLVFELGGDQRVRFAAPGLAPAEYALLVRPTVPIHVPGAAAGGAVLGEGTGWHADGAWSPSVLVEGSGYRMWFASSSAGGPARIGSASSPDGLDWTVSALPVIGPGVDAGACHAQGADEPSVARKADGTLLMLYRGRVDGRSHVCRAESADGLVWTPTAGSATNGAILVASPQRYDNVALGGGALLRGGDDVWRFVYGAYGTGEVFTGNVGIETLAGLGMAESVDSLVWSKREVGFLGSIALAFAEAPNPYAWDARRLVGPAVLVDGPVHRMYVSGEDATGFGIGYFTTLDLASPGPHVDILEHTSHALVPPGPPGRFDDGGAEHPAVVEGPDGVRRIWYTGTRQSDGRRRIGMAAFE